MSLNHPKPFHNSVAQYQGSAIPFVTSSADSEVTTTATIEVKFPKVTRFFVVKNTSANAMKWGFTANGVDSTAVGDQYYILSGGEGTERLELKCMALYFQGFDGSCNFSLLAGLTAIHESEFMILTGASPSGTNDNYLGFEGLG